MVVEHAPYEYIRNLSLIVFGYRKTGHRIMAFFTSYWDMSGKIADSPFLVTAGYVASTPQWELFVERWSEVLQRESLTHWHMTDFNARREEYAGWEDERYNRVYPEMIGIIRKYISLGVVSAVEVAAYQETVPGKELQEYFGEHPYKFCFLNCLAQVKDWLEENGISERVAHVLERGDDGYQEAKKTLDLLFDDEMLCKEWQLGAFTTVQKKDPCAIPCQAADILAWECRREIVEKRKISPCNPRLSLERLLVSPHSDVFWNKETLPHLIASFEKNSSK